MAGHSVAGQICERRRRVVFVVRVIDTTQIDQLLEGQVGMVAQYLGNFKIVFGLNRHGDFTQSE